MKTFIKWQGNKSMHINKFIQYIPEFDGRYIEPFVGSGALLLKLQPKKWIINDLNKDLVNVWKTVKNKPNFIEDEFEKFSRNFPTMDHKHQVLYCRHTTSMIPDTLYTPERATTFMLMKYCAYADIVNKNKFYFGSLDRNIYISNRYFFLEEKNIRNFYTVSDFLNSTKGKIYNKTYEKILEKSKKGDFVFLDPPYIEEHNYGFNYNIGETLDGEFLKNLLDQVKLLDKKNVKWMMTQADTKQIKNLFKNYTIKKFQVYRHSKKQYINELVIMNYSI